MSFDTNLMVQLLQDSENLEYLGEDWAVFVHEPFERKGNEKWDLLQVSFRELPKKTPVVWKAYLALHQYLKAVGARNRNKGAKFQVLFMLIGVEKGRRPIQKYEIEIDQNVDMIGFKSYGFVKRGELWEDLQEWDEDMPIEN